MLMCVVTEGDSLGALVGTGEELLGLSFENLQGSTDSITLAIPNVMKTDYLSA